MLAKIQAFLSLRNVCQLMSNGSILAPDLTTVHKEIYALNNAPKRTLFSPPPFQNTRKTKLWTTAQKHGFGKFFNNSEIQTVQSTLRKELISIKNNTYSLICNMIEIKSRKYCRICNMQYQPQMLAVMARESHQGSSQAEN